MANVVWSSAGDTNGNTAANWNPARVPTVGDTAYFDGTSVVGCTFSGAITCDGIVTVAAYTGAINLNGQTFTFTTAGMVLSNGVGSSFICGAAVIGITGGPLNIRYCTGWNASTSIITLNGVCTLTGSTSQSFYDLTVALGATVTNAFYCKVNHVLIISGAVVLNNVLGAVAAGESALDVVINSTANITGASYLQFYNPSAGHGITTLQAGAIVGNVYVLYPQSGAVFAPGTYTGWFMAASTSAISWILTLSAGTYTFNGGLELLTTSTGGLTLANNTNGPTITTTDLTIDIDSTGAITINDAAAGAVNWTITGNVVDDRTGAGTFTWTKGTGTITFSGAADQNVDLMDQTVEDVVVNKSAGNFVLSGGFTTDSFAGTSTGTGDFDPNGQTITVSGACDWAAAFVFDAAVDCLNGSAWPIAGNFTANGQTLKATAAWTLSVTGTAVASGAGAVAYSNAGAGTAITATGWTDNGNNTNWTFAAVGHPAIRRFGGIPAMQFAGREVY